MRRTARVIGLAAGLWMALPAHASPAAPLQGYDADLGQTSVSGLSSGAFMAVQFGVAFSSQLVGVGVVAGGPFDCANLFAGTRPAEAAQTGCMNPLGNNLPSAEQALLHAQGYAGQGRIDPLAGLARQRVYVFGGTMDRVVRREVVKQTANFFQLAGVKPENLRLVDNVAAGHAMLVANGQTGDPQDDGAACEMTVAPYINNCDFMLAHTMLRWIYGNLREPVNSTEALSGKLLSFDQTVFDQGGKALMGAGGYVYVPQACERQRCRVHVVFHGCGQGADKVGNRYARTTGYNQLADTNRLIVLYPQVRQSLSNPLGCWDFWGYTATPGDGASSFYAKTAPQLSAVMRMVQQLGKARTVIVPTPRKHHAKQL